MSDEENAPVLPGKGDSDYERYLRTDELLALQTPAEDRVHRDELLFQTVHQASELWLKFGVAEVSEATALIEAGDLAEAARLLRRAVRCIEYVIAQLDMLDQLDAWDYQLIRTALGRGSGFDSPGFREIARVTPLIGAAFERLLTREGTTLEDAYRRRVEFPRLHELAELLTDWDERLRLWRVRHYTVVARAIGEESIGIQGVPVQALAKLITQRQLPALWESRSRLVDLFEAERRGPASDESGSPARS